MHVPSCWHCLGKALELLVSLLNSAALLQGGFGGWTGSKLKTRLSNSVSAVEVLAPVFGTVRRAAGADGTTRVCSTLP